MTTLENIQNKLQSIAGYVANIKNDKLENVKLYNLIVAIPITFLHEISHIILMILLNKKFKSIMWGINRKNFNLTVNIESDYTNSFWKDFLVLISPVIIPITFLILTIFFYSPIMLILFILVVTCGSSYPSKMDLLAIKYWNRWDDYMMELMDEIEMPEDLK